MKHTSKKIITMLALTLMLIFTPVVSAYASNTESTEKKQETTTDNKDTSEATGAQLDTVVNPVVALIRSFIRPMLAIVGAAGGLYCILLGVKYAMAEEPQDREKAKAHLKNAIIGFVLIFVLILVLNLSIDPLTTWVENNAKIKIS